MRHAWLCIDPGITTGWAVLDDDGKVVATSVWGTEELAMSLDLLVRALFTHGFTVTCVIERMPQIGGMGLLGQKLESVRRKITGVVVDTYELAVVSIPPGEWKTSRVAKTREIPWHFAGTKMMEHQKDAIRMGWYAQEKGAKK